MCCHNPLDSLNFPVVRAETGAPVWMWAINASPVTMSQTITGFSDLTLQRHENGRVTGFTVTPVNTFPGEGGRLRAHCYTHTRARTRADPRLTSTCR